MQVKKIIVPLFLFFFSFAVSQTDDASYTTHVDAYVKSVEKNKTLYQGTKEGEIYEKDKIVGAYTTHPLFDRTNDRLFRIKYIEDTDTNVTTSFYWEDNVLVYASVKAKVKRKVITKASYYFKDGSVINVKGLNAKEEQAQHLLQQADLEQRSFYETWFKEEKP